MGYDENDDKIVGCRPAADGCREAIIVGSDDSAIISDEPLHATSLTLNQESDLLYYTSFDKGKLHAYSYVEDAERTISPNPGYARVAKFNEIDKKIYFDSDTNNQEGDDVITNADVSIWAYDTETDIYTQLTEDDDEVKNMTVQNISDDGKYVLVWANMKADTFDSRFLLVEAATGKHERINTDYVWPSSFRFSYVR